MKFSPVIKIKDENTHQTTASKIKDTTKRNQNPFRTNKPVLISCESVCDKIFSCGFCADRNSQLLSYSVTFLCFCLSEKYTGWAPYVTQGAYWSDTSGSPQATRAEGWGKALQTYPRAIPSRFLTGRLGKFVEIFFCLQYQFKSLAE